MIQRPENLGAFEFAVLASLRATQLTRGCLPRIDGGHTVVVTAQLEVAEGKVIRMPNTPVTTNPQTEDAPLASAGV